MDKKLQIGKLKRNLKYVGMIRKTLIKLSLYSQIMNS